jgi:ribosomal protein L11 methyltransferase
MDYFKIYIDFQGKDDDYGQIIIADLLDLGFESFEENEYGFYAYVPVGGFDKDDLHFYFSANNIKYNGFELIKARNWNEEWESEFQPIEVEDKLFIHASFHEPSSFHKLNICITPKMSFGTGHHATTQLICRYLLEVDFSGYSVLDMGTGTGILAVLAFKLGAKEIVATEIEDFAIENCRDNFEVNGLKVYRLIDYREDSGPYGKFDFILANINKNILIDQSEMYRDSLKPGGKLVISGFYESDFEELRIVFEALNLSFVSAASLDNWCLAIFQGKLM